MHFRLFAARNRQSPSFPLKSRRIQGSLLLGMALSPLSLNGCSDDSPPLNSATEQEQLQPEEARAAPSESETKATLVEEGRQLFLTQCSACHQAEGQGLPGLAPSLRNRDFLALASNEFITATALAGRPGTAMMARPDLAGPSIRSIVAYLRATPIANPVVRSVDPTRVITGDAEAGAHTYGLFCSSCHGPNGEGYLAGGSGPGIGMQGFLSRTNDDFIFQTIKYGRIGTPMMPFMGPSGLADLSEEQIKDVVAFLRTNPGAKAVPTQAMVKVGDPVRGHDLFRANCAACHQENGQGMIGLAPSIKNRDFLALASDEFITETVIKGRPGTAMFGRPDLADRLPDLIAFLRSGHNAIDVDWKVDESIEHHGNAQAGAEKFTLYCSSCHGSKGEGYAAGGSGPGIGMQGFLATASDDYIFQTVAHGRVGTPMRAFLGAKGLANLSEGDVKDIISHLRDL